MGRRAVGFLKNVYATIDELAPGFSDGIIGEQLLLPPDIERIINTPHGHIFHGELSLEQLFFQRPAPHYADYRSPVRASTSAAPRPTRAVAYRAFPGTMRRARS